MTLKIGVLFGGRSGEHEISLMSARSVLSALDPARYEIVQIGITKEGRWISGENALDKMLEGDISGLNSVAILGEPGHAGIYRIELDIERLKIYAPVNGMLDKNLFQLGERPKVGTTAAVILDSSRTYARIYVPAPLRVSVQPGEKLNVRIDGDDRSITGTVRWVSADASFTPYFALTEHDRSRLSYLAEVDVPDASSLPSGVPLEVDFPTGTLSVD